MIEVLNDFPDNVVAFIAKGRVTREDYEKTLIPKIESALEQHDKISCYYELGSAFSGMDAGAMWEDTLVGLEHLSKWDKVAAVTDIPWIAHVLSAFRFLMPGRLRVFPTSEVQAARKWVSEA